MTYKKNEVLKGEVIFQLGWDARVNETDIGVIVRDGVVTLTGRVGSYAEKLAAQDAAHRARGVLDVANEIEVQTSESAQPSDADIARAIRHALESDDHVPVDSIHSTVTHGWVTLEGKVESNDDPVRAERAITHLQGVRGVTNKMIVRAIVKSTHIMEIIEEVLEVRADREAERIRVKVDNGEVTLTGAVKSLSEKKSILAAVSHAPGVRSVHDRVFIDPYEISFESATR